MRNASCRSSFVRERITLTTFGGPGTPNAPTSYWIDRLPPCVASRVLSMRSPTGRGTLAIHSELVHPIQRVASHRGRRPLQDGRKASRYNDACPACTGGPEALECGMITDIGSQSS